MQLLVAKLETSLQPIRLNSSYRLNSMGPLCLWHCFLCHKTNKEDTRGKFLRVSHLPSRNVRPCTGALCTGLAFQRRLAPARELYKAAFLQTLTFRCTHQGREARGEADLADLDSNTSDINIFVQSPIIYMWHLIMCIYTLLVYLRKYWIVPNKFQSDCNALQSNWNVSITVPTYQMCRFWLTGQGRQCVSQRVWHH